jgi:hypothetical protein
MILQILERTPPWVFALFAALLILGAFLARAVRILQFAHQEARA